MTEYELRSEIGRLQAENKRLTAQVAAMSKCIDAADKLVAAFSDYIEADVGRELRAGDQPIELRKMEWWLKEVRDLT
jgi:hypothetical protein